MEILKKASLFLIYSLLLVLNGCNSHRSLQNTSLNIDIKDKERKDLLYIKKCLIEKKSVTDLINWKTNGEDSNLSAFEYRDKLVFFKVEKKPTFDALNSIVYYRNSFQKMIFVDESNSSIKITEKTQFKVWMSIDKRSIYIGVINENNLMIWVLSDGNLVYPYSTELK